MTQNVHKIGNFNREMKTLTDWNNFCRGRKILIQSGDWEGEETDFIEMIGEKEVIKDQNPKGIFMKVRTRFGTELLLQPGNPKFLIVDKKITQQGGNN